MHAGQHENLEPRVPEAGHEQHPNIRAKNAKLERQRDPVLTGHLDVDDQKVERTAVTPTHLQGCSAVVLGDDDNAIPREKLSDQRAYRRIGEGELILVGN